MAERDNNTLFPKDLSPEEELCLRFPDGPGGSIVMECPTPCQKEFYDAMQEVRKAENMPARKRNRFITGKYEQLYNAGIKGVDSNVGTAGFGAHASPAAVSYKSPNIWTGMAAIVSSQVGCMMDFTKQQASILGASVGSGVGAAYGTVAGAVAGMGVGSAPGAAAGGALGGSEGGAIGTAAGAAYGEDTEWLLGEGNLHLFGHMYPPMYMLSKLGYDGYLHCAEELHKHQKSRRWEAEMQQGFEDQQKQDGGKKDIYRDVFKLAPAVQKMKGGDLYNATNMVINYEQHKIAAPWYNKHKIRFWFIKYGGDAYGLFGKDVQSIPLSTKCGSPRPKVTFSGDLRKWRDRVNYFWELYRQWSGTINYD